MPDYVDKARKAQQAHEQKHDVQLELTEYTAEIPDYGDVMTIEDFRQCVADGSFIDYDGFGYPIKDNKCDNQKPISPSTVDSIPKDATHFVWFNR